MFLACVDAPVVVGLDSWQVVRWQDVRWQDVRWQDVRWQVVRWQVVRWQVSGEVNNSFFFYTGWVNSGSRGVSVRYQQASKKKLDEDQEKVLVLVVLELVYPFSLQETHHIVFGLGSVFSVDYTHALCVHFKDEAFFTPEEALSSKDGDEVVLERRGVFSQLCQKLEQFLARLHQVGDLIQPEAGWLHIHG